MLHCVSTLVGGNGGCRDAVACKDPFAEVYGAVGGIIVVGEHPGGGSYNNIIDAVVAEHLFSHLPSCEAIVGGDARISFKFRFQRLLCQETEQCY